MRLTLALLVPVLVACQPVPAAGPGPGPMVVDDRPKDPATCDVTLAASIVDGTLVVAARNDGAADVHLSLPDACPQGPVGFEGLPAGFDYYGTCTMGACPGDLPPIELHVPAGAMVEVARTSLELHGGTCNQPVPAGAYVIRPVVPDVGLAVCVEAAQLRHEPAAASNVDPGACTDDSECEVYCPDVEGCCGWPCGCRNAINRNHRDAAAAQHARSCERYPDCPAMGCAYEPAYTARCVDGRCRPSDGPF